VGDVYEIRIRGHLTDAARSALADMVGPIESCEGVMRAPICDQAQLRGVLARLDELGCEVIAARPISPGGPRR
jgi:hypothetical protein